MSKECVFYFYFPLWLQLPLSRRPFALASAAGETIDSKVRLPTGETRHRLAPRPRPDLLTPTAERRHSPTGRRARRRLFPASFLFLSAEALEVTAFACGGPEPCESSER